MSGETTSAVLDSIVVVSVRLLLFAKAKELSGCGQLELSSVPSQLSGAALKSRVLAELPQLRAIEDHFVLALDCDFVHPSDQLRLKDNCEVAVIPPLSGG